MSAQTEITLSEVIDGKNGYDDVAIEKAFSGFNILDAVQSTAGEEPKASVMTKVLRTGVFLHKRKEGLADAAAYDAAMSMSDKDINNYFAPDPEEIDPEDPDTEAGKGLSAPDSEPVTWPSSSS